MSVSRRASFAAGIAAVRRDRRGLQRLRDIEGGSSEDPAEDSGTVVTTTTSSTRTTTVRMASTGQDANAITVANASEKGGMAGNVNPFENCGAKLAGIAGAALLLEKSKPKMSVEVRSFTRESLEKINLRTSNLIRDYGFLPKRNPHLQDGAQLPPKFEPFPTELLGKPVEELDQYVYEKTFCVVSRRFNKNYVQRFSATRAMFIFPPWNIIRCIAIYLSTNQLFDYCVMFTILINCIFLAMSESNEEAEYIFLAIYSLESVIKCIAKGFILNNYTYLRSPWNWLDFLVIMSGYLTSFIEMGNLAGLRTFRVLRALKTISILPSLRTIINALLNAVKQLAEVMTLTIFCLMVFALFALQVYMGQLRNKCVLDIEQYDEGNGPKNWTEWVLNEDNWYIDEKGSPALCGNSTGAKSCPEGYVCLPNVGDNPNYGYTSFDNLLWSMLTTFQLITLDYWENVYNKIVATGGPMHVIFFTIVVFFGSFYLINLMLAVVAMSYEEEAEANNAERAKEAEEAATNQAQREPEEEECTIRTNAPQRIFGSVSAEDMCGQCSKNSKEALERGASHSGSKGCSDEPGGSRVVAKARQVGSEIQSLDLRDHYNNPEASFYKGCDYEGRYHSSVDASSLGGGSDDGRHGHHRHLSPTMEEGNGFCQSDDQYSLSNYSSSGFSNKSSLNDSGVVGDQEMDSVSEDKLRLHVPMSDHDAEIINCKDKVNGKRLSTIDKPMIVSVETSEDRNCPGCRRCCISYSCWLKFQDFLFRVVHDTFFDGTVTLCIILNTAFLAIEHHGMSQELDETLEMGNKVFTAFFSLEAVLKLLALSKEYFSSGWNIFDLIIVVASLIDLSVESVNGISVLRGMRLMRVLKLAQSWTTMKVLLSIIISTLGALGNLTFLLIIVIYIFAVLGMQLFGKTYTEENFYPDPVPRWNFTDFFHSFMMIFRILCGEWIEPLWDCMRAEARLGVAESCLAIFLPALVVGNFMVLNLFLALLLNSFNCEELKSRKESLEQEEVKNDGGNLVAQKLNKVKDKFTRKKKKDKLSLEDSKSQKFSSNGSLLSQNGLKPNLAGSTEIQKQPGGQSKSLTFDEALAGAEMGDIGPETEVKSKIPDQCCPSLCGKIFWCCNCFSDTCFERIWSSFRQVIHDVVDNPFFEWTILLLIFASSLSLCFEDINLQDNEELMFILKIVNMVFAVLFTIEMVLKWIAFGLWRYFTSAWTCLDFVIVCVSILSLAVEGSANLTALRSLRTLRALRPLRAISRWQGMKIVVNALMYAIPSIFNVLLVCLVFWLIFSIMGVQFFGGKFYKCVDESGDRLPVEVVDNIYECAEKNYSWVNSKITFDHVGHAYLALFQVATFEGWMEVMADAVDCREVDQQPSYEASKYNYFYFVIFIVCGSFFTLNLFIGVIIDNFNALKKKYEGGVLEMFLTESQKNYYTAMKKLGRKKPQKVVRRPTNELHALFYDISLSRRFEIAIFVLIFLNMVAMGIEHYNQSRVITFTLEISNALFTTIFSLECVVKIIGLRFQYFTVGWNIFDFVLVIASIIGIVMEDMMQDFPVSPTLLRVVRVFRIGRILRLIKAAKGIRKLLFALIVSLPALFNIGALLALITFIYAIIGMTLFGHVKHQGALNDQVNFETFGRSMQLLFRLVTSAGWNDVLEPLLVTPPDCDIDFKGLPNGNCGHPFVAIIYFVSFIIINFMIVINMYIAIILENFNQAHQEEEIGIVEEDLEMFYTKWAKFDPHATQFISFHQMSDFIASLDAPLGIPKPNLLALVSFDLPIAKGDKIHCLDVLHSLTKYTLGFIDDNSEDFSKLAGQMDEKFKKQFPTRKELEIVSSTREWKKLDNAARIIQKFFKVYVKGVNIEERIDIHTQTFGQQRKVRPPPKPGAAPGGNVYLGTEPEAIIASDTEWKTQSLPSLGHVSSDNTLESLADDYVPTRKATQKKNRKKSKKDPPSVMSDEMEGQEETNHSDNHEQDSAEEKYSEHGKDAYVKESSHGRHGVYREGSFHRDSWDRNYPRTQSRNYNRERDYPREDQHRVLRESGKDLGRDYPPRPRDADFPSDKDQDLPREKNRDSYREQARESQRRKPRDSKRVHEFPGEEDIEPHSSLPREHDRDYPRDHLRDFPREDSRHFSRDQTDKYSRDPENYPDQDQYDVDQAGFSRDDDAYLRDHSHLSRDRDYYRDPTIYPRDEDHFSRNPEQYSRDQDLYPASEYSRHERSWSQDPEFPRTETENFHWERQEHKRDSARFQSRTLDSKDPLWDQSERYLDFHRDISPTVRPVKPDSYRCLPQRPQSFSASETCDVPLPRRKLPQIPVRESNRPMSYVHTTTTRHQSVEGGRVQSQQYHSNPHLSIGGPLPTHYESYYHELRVGDTKTSPHSSLRQLPPTPMDGHIHGHRRTASSGGIAPQNLGKESRPADHRLSYQEEVLGTVRPRPHGIGAHHNFSSLPRDHRVNRPRSEYYRGHNYREHPPVQKRTSYPDEEFIHSPQEDLMPTPRMPYTDNEDEVEQLEHFARRKLPLFEEQLHSNLPYSHFASTHSQPRYPDYAEDLETNPDYYEFEAKYTQADPAAFETERSAHHVPDYPRGHSPVSQHYGRGQGYRDYEREPLRTKDEPRAPVKHQLSWEKYSEEDPTEELRYVVPEQDTPLAHTGARARSHHHSKHEEPSERKPHTSPAKKQISPRDETDGSKNRDETRKSKHDRSSKSRSRDEKKTRHPKKTESGEAAAKPTTKHSSKEGHSQQRTSRHKSSTHQSEGPRSDQQQQQPRSDAPAAPSRESHRTDSQRRSIRRQPRISSAHHGRGEGGGGGGGGGDLSDGFDDDGLFHFDETDGSEQKQPRRKK